MSRRRTTRTSRTPAGRRDQQRAARRGLHKDRFELLNFAELSPAGLAEASKTVLDLEQHARTSAADGFAVRSSSRTRKRVATADDLDRSNVWPRVSVPPIDRQPAPQPPAPTLPANVTRSPTTDAEERGEPDDGLDWRRWVPASARALIAETGFVDDDADPAGWRRYVPAEWRHWLDDSPAPRPQGRTLRFIGIDEDRPGARWRALFDETWPAYRAWWLGKGAAQRPDRHRAEAALTEHMPELVPVYRELVALGGDDDVAAASSRSGTRHRSSSPVRRPSFPTRRPASRC